MCVCVCAVFVFIGLLVCETVCDSIEELENAKQSGRCKVFIRSWFSDKLIPALLRVTVHFRALTDSPDDTYGPALCELSLVLPQFRSHRRCTDRCSHSAHYVTMASGEKTFRTGLKVKVFSPCGLKMSIECAHLCRI